jgi:hypothetical protein
LEVDCRLRICELLGELKAVKLSYLEEELMWHGVEKDDVDRSVKMLQERGIIYRRKGGLLELTEPSSN